MADYVPDPRGLAEIGGSAKLGDLCVEAAEAGAAYARSVAPAGSFRAERRTVTAGWRNESRAGAAIVNDNPDALRDERQFRALDATPAVVEQWRG